MNSLTREKGDTKEFRRLVLCSFGKGRRETQKEFRQLVLGEFFLAKGEGNEKMNSTVFKVWKTRKTLESFWQKGRRRSIKGFSKMVLKKCFEKLLFANQSLAFIDSSSLVKKTFRRVITFRKTLKTIWKRYNFQKYLKTIGRVTSFDFVQKLSLVIDYQSSVIDYIILKSIGTL